MALRVFGSSGSHFLWRHELKGCYIGDYTRNYFGGYSIKGITRSLDYSSGGFGLVA